ncbi:MAG TPA: quaternary ammonium transporter [Chloroflexi bacterium]|nr:quaternary ammonium transporter [Chloroflexota bacterium]
MKQAIGRVLTGGVILILMLLSACAGQPGGSAGGNATIRVASKDFTEQFILGHMYALVLENAGFTVERRLNLGGTPVVHEALLNGQVDLYPEYTGTGLLTVLKQEVMSDPAAVYQTVNEMYREQFDLVWLQPAPMNNTQALAMTRARAEDLGIRTISDMVARAGELVMVGPPEFVEREDGLPGIKAVYGDFELRDYIAVDPGLRYQALTSGEADVAVAFGTDGEIAAFDLVVLEDDRNMFPPYQVAPVIRSEVLEANPGIEDVLNDLSARITNEVMQSLNYEVSGNQREPEEVAREWLQQQGLIE